MQNLFHSVFLCLILTVISFKTDAQNRIDYPYIDSTSYYYYLSNEWKELIRTANKGFKNNIDYYYLRMRAGIAYYERKNYRNAARNFRKASALNHLEKEPPHYLFYSSLLKGDRDMGKYMYHKYNRTEDLLPAAGLKPVSLIQLLSTFHKNPVNNPINKIIPEFPVSDGYQKITNSLLYNSLLLKHDISPSLYLTHSLGMMRKENYYINSSQGMVSQSDVNKSRQYQYYAALKLIPADNLFITAAIHYIHFSSDNILYRDISSGIRYPVPGTKLNNFVGDLSLFKSFWLIDAGAGLTIGNLNNQNQFQQNFTLAFYPLGNLNLYTVSRLNLIHEKRPDKTAQHYPVIRNTLGFKIFENLWFEGTLWNGEFKNAALNEGYYILNSNENLTSKYDISLIIPMKNISMGIQFSNTDYYTSLYSLAGMDTGENKKHYNSYNLLISLQWNM